jgi:hypothetical protein
VGRLKLKLHTLSTIHNFNQSLFALHRTINAVVAPEHIAAYEYFVSQVGSLWA